MPRASVISLAVLCAALACGGSNAAPAASAPTNAAPTPVSTKAAPDSVTDIADRNRIMGKATATVWMIEVSDFQCPFCKTFHDSTYPAIKKDYVDTGKIRLAYLNLPLPMHPNAQPAAHAAMCASLQGKFWEAHDRIFDSQDKWKGLADARAFLDSVVVAAGADRAKLTACTESKRLAPLIQADMDRSAQAGAQSTPMFFVGNHKILGAAPIAAFRAAIDSALAGK